MCVCIFSVPFDCKRVNHNLTPSHSVSLVVVSNAVMEILPQCPSPTSRTNGVSSLITTNDQTYSCLIKGASSQVLHMCCFITPSTVLISLFQTTPAIQTVHCVNQP